MLEKLKRKKKYLGFALHADNRHTSICIFNRVIRINACHFFFITISFLKF